jgi:hypothetical protein
MIIFQTPFHKSRNADEVSNVWTKSESAPGTPGYEPFGMKPGIISNRKRPTVLN